MKIESSNSAAIVPKQRIVKSESTTKTESQHNETKPTELGKLKISRWFTQIGLSPNAEYVDYKAKSVAARRHQDIRAVKRCENLQKIMHLACYINVSDVAEEDIDPDWFYAFVDLAENIYTPVMQELWGKILAVEVSRPGSFSLRSLETLRRLTQRDAQLFTLACKLASRKVGDPIPRIITHYNQRQSLLNLLLGNKLRAINIGNYGLSYPALLALIDLGLLMHSEIESAELPLKQTLSIRCGESAFEVTPKKTGLAMVYYKFTNVGAELFLLSRRKENKEYVETLKRTLSLGFTVK